MDIVAEVALVIGAAWCVLAAVGVNRFGDVYARMHAATKSTTLGALLVVGGAGGSLGGLTGVKMGLAALLLFLTAPLGAHLVGRAVRANQGAAPVRIDAIDELERDDH